MELILGYIAMSTGLLATFWGFPAQILKFKKSKCVEGVSISLWFLFLSNTTAWFCYGMFRENPDWFIVFPNIFSIIFVIIILTQIFYYKTPKE